MIAELSGALSALRGTFDLANLAIEVRDGNRLNEAKLAMNERLIDVTSSALALQEKQAALVQEKQALEAQIGDLKRKIGDLEAWDRGLEQYERTQTQGGAIAYVDKSTRESPSGPVYLCANCINDRKKTFLQPDKNRFWLECPTHGKIRSEKPDRSVENMQKMLDKLGPERGPNEWMR
ncbi:hypothetical protein KDH83_13040 [Achromobacter sp. Marseille-Q0513]|uniref:hypothetical protein n=1 Tax=Achromobacter sp. Marseille-Q0513 TaxID=2829161 RepID=UPI001B8F701A|nr:hypothetical protein [Achromobacter sp. Marseille-Q0513]MBR8654220.1 hypothetical protein [Achromobacter sp. Marseille-Q0513]